MRLHATLLIPFLFFVLALVSFLVGVLSDTSATARRVRMRIALIFLVVGIGLLILHTKTASP
jgi:uncharacterized protein YqhQ